MFLTPSERKKIRAHCQKCTSRPVPRYVHRVCFTPSFGTVTGSNHAVLYRHGMVCERCQATAQQPQLKRTSDTQYTVGKSKSLLDLEALGR